MKDLFSTALRRGQKQHGAKIARTDNMTNCRKSITCITSTWSDGSGGPIGLCLPTNVLDQEAINAFNEKYYGRAFLLCSESTSHFMTSDTYLILMKELISTAFEQQRVKHNVSRDTPGLLLCDGWSGFHSYKSGHDLVRSKFASMHNITLADRQCGGWSANGQPCDQIHHMLRSRLDLVDAAAVECGPNLKARPRYDTMAIRPNGQPMHPKADDARSLCERTVLAWESMPTT